MLRPHPGLGVEILILYYNSSKSAFNNNHRNNRTLHIKKANEDSSVMFWAQFSRLCGSKWLERTELQMFRQQGSGHNLKSFPCLSSAAGSCLPSTPGSCQIFWPCDGPIWGRKQPQITTKFPGKNTNSILWVCLCGRSRVCRCTHTQRHSNISKTPYACGGFSGW